MVKTASGEPAVKRERSRLTKEMPTNSCSRGQTRLYKTQEEAQSTIKPVLGEQAFAAAEPAAVARKTSSGLKKGASRNASLGEQGQICGTIEHDESGKQVPEAKQCDDVPEAPVCRPSSRLTCKRGRSGAPKLSLPSRCVNSDNVTTKYRRPHCPMCSQLGCLRNLEVICYCDACQESRGAECSSPRMADFRKSHPGYVSRSGQSGCTS